MKEPEKPAEAEGCRGENAEGSSCCADGDKPAAEGAEGEKKEGEEKKLLKQKNNQLN